jgi:thioredoxin-related protein
MPLIVGTENNAEDAQMKKYKNVILYSLSTCFWCSKTKKLLKEMNVDFEEIYGRPAE